ncbi:pentatricopeptide repeat-containing protein At1g43980, mitochondrial-like [Neltuma alba]|uniref:pentatricopeptide repeat-containing protein At1g43980, mitochondrial-like n=1 Tax=Neltuma alba TaxID=207710 RepID=UPI0010A56B22|nr:pentatricopeptide repeat-containing protein At1g43980, mitochondrial-like isoform X1 [Prosopis alba]XP_028794599.1 pentatricopeptide repeat-containing protein At1g43980, mitochondrial-like [Prosopis alba]
MPVRDVVSWNTMISGYSSYGFGDQAFQIFLEMQNIGTRPSVFTYTIMVSLVSSPCQGKQIHGRLIRSGMNFSNLVLGNSLINMYGNFGLVDYSFGVISTMKQLDIISWNSLIWACHNAGHQELALEQFHRMRSKELFPDEFTSSILISVCSNLQDLEQDWRIPYSFLENNINGTQLYAVP